MSTSIQTYLLVPGAWMGSWMWDDLTNELKSHNQNVHSLTLTGLHNSEKQPDATLETHIQDVITYIEKNQLNNIVLVGHSYSGAVVGQIADRVPDCIARLIFIEAALPINGQSMLESYGNDVAAESKSIEENDGLWPHLTADELGYEKALSGLIAK